MNREQFTLQNTVDIFSRLRCHAKFRTPKNLFLQLFIACGVYIATFIQQIEFVFAITLIVQIVLQGSGMSMEAASAWLDENSMLLFLFSTVATIVAVALYCFLIERRTPRNMGFSRYHVFSDYLIGMIAGVGTLSAALLIAWLGGSMEYVGMNPNIAWGTLGLFFLGWMIQGFSEEFLCRSYLMMSVGAHHRPWVAVFINAIIFAALHLGNDNISVLAILNLTLYGIVASLYYLRTDSVWGIAAMHSMWNCAQGNLFGIEVSGNAIDDVIWKFQPTGEHLWLSGGSFGLEGGLGVTIVELLSILVLLCIPQRKVWGERQ